MSQNLQSAPASGVTGANKAVKKKAEEENIEKQWNDADDINLDDLNGKSKRRKRDDGLDDGKLKNIEED